MNGNILEERLNEVHLAWTPSYTTLQGEEVGVDDPIAFVAIALFDTPQEDVLRAFSAIGGVWRVQTWRTSYDERKIEVVLPSDNGSFWSEPEAGKFQIRIQAYGTGQTPLKLEIAMRGEQHRADVLRILTDLSLKARLRAN